MRTPFFVIMLLSVSSALGQGCWELEVKTCEAIFGETEFCFDSGRCIVDPENSDEWVTRYKCVDFDPENPQSVESRLKVLDYSVWTKIPAPPGQFGWSNWITPNVVMCGEYLKCTCIRFPWQPFPDRCTTDHTEDGEAIIVGTVYVPNEQPVGVQNCIGAGIGGGAN
jgi:hypothetical protein